MKLIAMNKFKLLFNHGKDILVPKEH